MLRSEEENEILCRNLDYRRLFFYMLGRSAEEADILVGHARRVCREKYARPRG